MAHDKADPESQGSCFFFLPRDRLARPVDVSADTAAVDAAGTADGGSTSDAGVIGAEGTPDAVVVRLFPRTELAAGITPGTADTGGTSGVAADAVEAADATL